MDVRLPSLRRAVCHGAERPSRAIRRLARARSALNSGLRCSQRRCCASAKRLPRRVRRLRPASPSVRLHDGVHAAPPCRRWQPRRFQAIRVVLYAPAAALDAPARRVRARESRRWRVGKPIAAVPTCYVAWPTDPLSCRCQGPLFEGRWRAAPDERACVATSYVAGRCASPCAPAAATLRTDSHPDPSPGGRGALLA